jgi:hypothetical protein
VGSIADDVAEKSICPMGGGEWTKVRTKTGEVTEMLALAVFHRYPLRDGASWEVGTT